jgi:hypothetical protein
MKDNTCRKKMPSWIIEVREILICRNMLSKMINNGLKIQNGRKNKIKRLIIYKFEWCIFFFLLFPLMKMT